MLVSKEQRGSEQLGFGCHALGVALLVSSFPTWQSGVIFYLVSQA